MPYDADLADRLRETLAGRNDVTEKRMFGGLAFLVGGRLVVAASQQGGMLLRVDPADSETLVEHPHVERMVMRGRELAGWLHLDERAVASDEELRSWVRRGLDVRTLDPAQDGVPPPGG